MQPQKCKQCVNTYDIILELNNRGAERNSMNNKILSYTIK